MSASASLDIDSVCLVHGKRLSQHDCLYCCLCFDDLTLEECHVRDDGQREDVCNECAAMDAAVMATEPAR
jgi:hypothetical protein